MGDDAAHAAVTGDEELMQAFATGNEEAFAQLYGRHRDAVYRFFLRQLGREEAQEAHQETWLRVIRASSRYRPTSAFRKYLFTIAHNVLTDHWRRASRRGGAVEPSVLDGLASADDPVADAALAQRLTRLFAIIETLPPEQREAFLLREEAGLSNDEIANVTGVNVETVRSRIRYAVKKLRGGLERHEQSH